MVTVSGQFPRVNYRSMRLEDVVDVLGITWTPKVCEIMALLVVIMGLGLLFYMLWGFR